MPISRTDTGWEKIFRELALAKELESAGIAVVTADQIKSISGREPRLMSKFDTREYRPDVLKRHDVTVLPIRNGAYALVVGNGYAELPTPKAISSFSSEIVNRLETLPLCCRSESQVIDVAHATGILHDFFGEKNLVLTIRGRLRTMPFDFIFEGRLSHRLSVDGVQVEIDAGFEGERVYLIEAKMGARDNFIVRQLYYAYRMWQAAGIKKAIVPVFLTCSDETFSLVEYAFDDPDRYGSLRRVRTRAYRFDAVAETVDLNSLLAATQPINEPLEIPFPQANDMRKVMDVIDAVAWGIGGRRSIREFYEFADRQASYYTDAARYLGFLEGDRGTYRLTPTGVEFAAARGGERSRVMAKAMLERPVLRSAVAALVKRGAAPSSDQLNALIGAARPELRGATLRRRASSFKQWIDWLRQHFDDGRL